MVWMVAEHMTWEPESNLDNCPDIVEEYWKSVQNPETAGNISETGDHSLVRGDRPDLVEVLDRLGKALTSLQGLLPTQVIKQGEPEGFAFGRTTRKRKLPQMEQGFPKAGEDEVDAHLDTGTRIRVTEREGIKRKRRPHRKHCRICKETGHNSRACPTAIVHTSS